MTPVRVLLVDDQQMLIEALAARLASTPDIMVVGHCTTRDPHRDALVTALRPDVITIEVAQVQAVATLLASLHAACPPARVVVLTASRDPQQAVEAARAGADGWVSKESSIGALADALRSASRRDSYFPPEQLGHVLRDLRADVGRVRRREGPLDVLTPRERDVLTCLAQGRCPAEIAGDLGMSANTVRTHTNKIFTKLGVHSRLEAVAVARGALCRGQPPPAGVAAAVFAQEPAASAQP
ncbi:MAG: DNA-binding response regulator [Pseudonocardiales bacterium]|nr:MAG: DNA-binding response regulator [Pseudonocardiales bacterium]